MYPFVFDKRLGIHIPIDTLEFGELSVTEQEEILLSWEKIRGYIPDRIKELEILINEKQGKLNQEENFVYSCQLNSEIAELASIINDLWLWYRTQQDVSTRTHL